MRDAMGPDQMNKWKAFRTLQPDSLERIAEILKRGFAAVANVWGGKFEPDDFEPCKEKERGYADQQATPDQAAMVATSILGNPNNG